MTYDCACRSPRLCSTGEKELLTVWYCNCRLHTFELQAMGPAFQIGESEMSAKKTGKATGKSVAKTADKKTGRQSIKAPENKTGTEKPVVAKKTKGEFGVVAGTRKEQVAIELKAKGSEAALALGLELGLASGTIKSWIGAWKTKGLWKPEAKPAKASKGMTSIKQAADAAADVAAKVAMPEEAKKTDQVA